MEETVTLKIPVPRELKDKLKADAKLQGCSMATMIRQELYEKHEYIPEAANASN